MSRECAVSVIIATRNRAQALEETLRAFVHAPVSAQWELLVIDNGSDATPAVLASFIGRLPLIPLTEPAAGKARALNRALGIVQGRLILFTDDDVTIDREWMSEFERAAREQPSVNVFCGPIVPLFPPDTPLWLRDHPFAVPAFAQFTPKLPEGLLPAPLVPFGANFAARAHVINGSRFNEALGPGERNLMNEDTEFLRRLRNRGEEIAYVPTAGVMHRLLDERVSPVWLFERAYALGRSAAIERGDALVVELSSRTASADHLAEIKQFELGAHINFYFGQLSELFPNGNRKQCEILHKLLAGMEWRAHHRLLTPAAAAWVQDHPGIAAAVTG